MAVSLVREKAGPTRTHPAKTRTSRWASVTLLRITAVILQDDRFDTESVTLCPLTTDPTDAPLLRLTVDATPTTGLNTTSRLMVDKITTVRRAKLGERIGELDDADILRLNRAVVTFLGIAN